MRTLPKSTTRRLRGWALRAARVTPVPRWILGAPRWLWPALETTTAAAVAVGLVVAVTVAWGAAAGAGAPWWAGPLALAFPVGATARLAKEAPRTLTRYCNWRDHTIDRLAALITGSEGRQR